MEDKEYLDASEFIEDGKGTVSVKTSPLASVDKLQSEIAALKRQGKDTLALEQELTLLMSSNEVFE